MTITGAEGRADLRGLTRDAATRHRASELAAGLVGRRAETEALRRVPDETMNEFVASGLMRVNQAARWGGAELGTEAAVEVIAEIAKGDASAGWVFGLIASHFWLVCLFPPEVQEEMWGADPNVMMSSSFAPSEAQCERVEGGYRVRGRWPWSSGSNHCTWAMLGIMLPPDGPDQTADAGVGNPAAGGLHGRRRLAHDRAARHRFEHAHRRRRLHPRPPLHQPVGRQRGERTRFRLQPRAAVPSPVRARARVLPVGAGARRGGAHVRRLDAVHRRGSGRPSPAPRWASRRPR